MYFLCPQAQDDNEETLHEAAIERELLQDKLQAADASSTLTEVDRERNKLVSDTARSGVLDGYYWVDRFHLQREGYNGGGDRYVTDGRLAVGVISLAR